VLPRLSFPRREGDLYRSILNDGESGIALNIEAVSSAVYFQRNNIASDIKRRGQIDISASRSPSHARVVKRIRERSTAIISRPCSNRISHRRNFGHVFRACDKIISLSKQGYIIHAYISRTSRFLLRGYLRKPERVSRLIRGRLPCVTNISLGIGGFPFLPY